MNEPWVKKPLGPQSQKAIPVTIDQLSVQRIVDDVRDVMGTDTATLLLLDESGSVLRPTASSGMGRRWRGAPHVRVGTGFAGRVAERGEPVMVNEVNELSVLNPFLREAGVKRLLGVPVPGPAGTLGVLHVGSFSPGSFTGSDAERLSRMAAEIGGQLSESTVGAGHLAALALQRSLLPAAPPLIEGLDIAVRYLPADGDLGGDWYDIFELPGGRVAIVMGDVEGHGLRSAVVMGRLRSALRAYALDHADPSEVLHRLDRKLCYFETDIRATVLYAVTEPPFDHVTVCSAGHPVPLFAAGGADQAEVTRVIPDLLLGVDPEFTRHNDKVSLPPGSALAFFTDGLVERRGTDGVMDPYGAQLELLVHSFTAGPDAEAVCSRMIAAGLGDDVVDDDVALVVLRRPA